MKLNLFFLEDRGYADSVSSAVDMVAKNLTLHR